MVTVGTHHAKAIEAALTVAKTGTEQVAVAFQIVSGDEKGQTITWYGFLSDKCFDRTVESLRILGWQGDDMSDLASVIGGEASIVVQEKSDGKYTEVRWVNRLGGAGIGGEKLTGDAAKQVAARLRDRVRSFDAAAAQVAQQQSANGGKAPPF